MECLSSQQLWTNDILRVTGSFFLMLQLIFKETLLDFFLISSFACLSIFLLKELTRCERNLRFTCMDLTLFSVAKLLICRIWIYLLSIIEKITKYSLSTNQCAGFVTESKLLCLPQDKLMNPRWGLGIGRDFIWEGADWKDGRLEPQNNHLVWTRMSDSFMNPRWGEVRKQSKKPLHSYR